MKLVLGLMAALVVTSGLAVAQQRPARAYAPWVIDEQTFEALKNAIGSRITYNQAKPIIDALDERENEAASQAQMAAQAKAAADNEARQKAASKALNGKVPPPIRVEPRAPAQATAPAPH